MGEEKCAPSPETSFCLSQWPILKMSLTKVGCTREEGTILFKTLSSEEALLAARKYVGLAYNFFVTTVIFSGLYYLFLLRTARIETRTSRRSES